MRFIWLQARGRGAAEHRVFSLASAAVTPDPRSRP
jgi:hypothetical protein